MKKILTLDQLVSFCESHNFTKFDAKETGHQIVVSIPATFEEQKSVTVNNDSLLVCKVKMFHTGLNRNGSNVTREAAKEALSGIAYTPLLAAFADFKDDNGKTYTDFTTHEILYDENGEPIEYIEQQVGAFTADEPEMIYDESTGRYYIYAYVAIPREYTKAAEIIERKDGTKVSVELDVNEMSYDAKNKVLNLENIAVRGCTCLGRNRYNGTLIEEGMEGARLDIADFSTDFGATTSCEYDERFEKLNNTLEMLNTTLSHVVTIYEDGKKGGNDKLKFKELLEKYNKVESDITFDYENMTDEELEAAFAKAFDDEVTAESSEEQPTVEDTIDESTEEAEETEESTEMVQTEETVESESVAVPEANAEYAVKELRVTLPHGEMRSFELSLSDIEIALYNLVCETYDYNAYPVDVYDDYLVMHDYADGKLYKQNYTRNDCSFALDGERIEVFAVYVTADEQKALDALRLNYEAVSKELAEYKVKEDKAKAKELLASADYDGIRETEEYKALMQESELSFESIKTKADEILLMYAKKGALKFASDEKPASKVRVRIGLDTPAESKKGRYGNFFSK